MRNILRLLVNEQLLITLSGIIIGIIIGETVSFLFVPLLQISYSAADQMIPLLITFNASDYISLFVSIGATILVCLGILGFIISKIKIAQALKLGED